MESTGSVRRTRLRAPQRRAVVLAAAAELFADRGYAGTRLDDIAAAAQVTKPILYRHFPSKKALYLALLARHREEQLRLATNGQTDGQPITTFVERWFDQVRGQPQTWQMIFRDTTGDAEIQAARRAAQEQARSLLVAFLGAGSGPALPDIELEAAAELVRSAMAGLASWSLVHPDVPTSRLATLIEQTVVAVRPRR